MEKVAYFNNISTPKLIATFDLTTSFLLSADYSNSKLVLHYFNLAKRVLNALQWRLLCHDANKQLLIILELYSIAFKNFEAAFTSKDTKQCIIEIRHVTSSFDISKATIEKFYNLNRKAYCLSSKPQYSSNFNVIWKFSNQALASTRKARRRSIELF